MTRILYAVLYLSAAIVVAFGVWALIFFISIGVGQ